jgi:hypothetical protein
MVKEESLNKLLGKQCKIVTKEPGDKKNHIVVGVILEIEYDEKFMIIESSYGIGCLNTAVKYRLARMKIMKPAIFS